MSTKVLLASWNILAEGAGSLEEQNLPPNWPQDAQERFDLIIDVLHTLSPDLNPGYETTALALQEVTRRHVVKS